MKEPKDVFRVYLRLTAILSLGALASALLHCRTCTIKEMTVRFVGASILGAILVGVVCIIHFAIKVKLIPGRTALFTSDGTVKQAFPKWASMWRKDWRALSKGCVLAPFYDILGYRITKTCTPITENPKARKIEIFIEAGVQGNPENFGEFYRRFGFFPLTRGKFFHSDLNQTVKRSIMYQLYELMDSKSRELGQFTNPLEPTQQTEFSKLVNCFIGPKLVGTGICIIGASFSLPD